LFAGCVFDSAGFLAVPSPYRITTTKVSDGMMKDGQDKMMNPTNTKMKSDGGATTIVEKTLL
jgi:hypothetical protein